MNCKPGDLAIVTWSETGCLGHIVEVLRPYDGYVFANEGPSWWVMDKGQKMHCCDSCLRPLRDPGEDAQDETLTWLPVPQPELV